MSYGGSDVQLNSRSYLDEYLSVRELKEDNRINRDIISNFYYERKNHTLFYNEQMVKNFSSMPDFGGVYSCSITENADLIGKIYLVIDLPEIILDKDIYFSWMKCIGFSIIKSVEIEINDKIIDKHNGEWLYLNSELNGNYTNNNSDGFNKMIGNIEELYKFTNHKDKYTLYIPLNFWFCKSSYQYLPITALKQSKININLELEDFYRCFLYGPTCYINCDDNFTGFYKFEYLEQSFDNFIAYGIFIDYNIIEKRLYYIPITSNKFEGLQTNNISNDFIYLSQTDFFKKYKIIGKSSQYIIYPKIDSKSYSINSNIVEYQNIQNCFLLVDYYYLDSIERDRFKTQRLEYLIEKLYYTLEQKTDRNEILTQIYVDNSCKFITWIVQYEYINKFLDIYNYTDNHINKHIDDIDKDGDIYYPIGDSIVSECSVLFNNKERLSLRDEKYFNKIQPYLYLKKKLKKGIYFYTFSLEPLNTIKPSGSYNSSKIEKTSLYMKLKGDIRNDKKVLYRVYSICYNIFIVVNGLGSLKFIK